METELVESALAGSIESFGDLCTRYYDSMVAVAYSILTDHHLARDAAQETYVRALQNLHKLKQKKRFAFWLAGICRNVARDMAKTKFREVALDDNDPPTENQTVDFDRTTVRKAIDSLSPSAKELITMRYYNKLSHEQMAKVLNLSKPAINNRLTRARKKLAKYLERNGFNEVQL